MITGAGAAGETRQLARAINSSQFFTLAFGCIIGVAWVVVLGELLGLAGPLGTMLAFVGGGLIMVVVGLCYAEVTTALPVSGGEVAYAYEIFGLKTCFATGWFLALAHVAITAFEGVSFSWIAYTLYPALRGRVVYVARGTEVNAGTLIMGLGGMFLLTFLNYHGVKTAVRFQEFLTYLKICIALVCIYVGLRLGHTANLNPLFSRDSHGSAWPGVLAVFLTTPFWYAGFNVISETAAEKERTTSLHSVGRVIVLSIIVAIVFYCFVIFAWCMLYPWRELARLNMGIATVFQVSFGSTLLTRMVLLAALLGNITAWNSFSIGASRVLFALGRARIVGESLGVVHPIRRSPSRAIGFVGIVSSCGILLGRGLILPIVNVTSSCYSLVFLLVCVGVIKMRLNGKLPKAAYRMPGGIVTAFLGSLGSLFVLLVSLYQPYAARKPGVFPTEWTILLAWVVLGCLFWLVARRTRGSTSDEQRRQLILPKDLD